MEFELSLLPWDRVRNHFLSTSALTSAVEHLSSRVPRPLEFARWWCGASRRAPLPLHSLRTQPMGTWAPVDDVWQPCSRPACRVADVWFSSPLGTESAVVYSALRRECQACQVPGARRPKILQLQKSGDKTGSLLVSLGKQSSL